MKKLKVAADEAKRTTIGELMNLPNRYMHTYFADGLRKIQAASENPEGPEAKELQGQALADQLTGAI